MYVPRQRLEILIMLHFFSGLGEGRSQIINTQSNLEKQKKSQKIWEMH